MSLQVAVPRNSSCQTRGLEVRLSDLRLDQRLAGDSDCLQGGSWILESSPGEV